MNRKHCHTASCFGRLLGRQIGCWRPVALAGRANNANPGLTENGKSMKTGANHARKGVKLTLTGSQRPIQPFSAYSAVSAMPATAVGSANPACQTGRHGAPPPGRRRAGSGAGPRSAGRQASTGTQVGGGHLAAALAVHRLVHPRHRRLGQDADGEPASPDAAAARAVGKV